MRIRQFVPCSYTDFPGNVACVVYFGEAYPFKDSWTESRIVQYMIQNKQLIDGVVLRGNEPTLEMGVVRFCKRIKALGFAIKVDTTGLGPDVLKKLIDESLVDYISMELKAPPEKYLKLTGTAFSKVKEAYRLVRSFKPHEFKTEVNDDLDYTDVRQIASLTNKDDYFIHPAINETCQVERPLLSWSRALGVRFRGTML